MNTNDANSAGSPGGEPETDQPLHLLVEQEYETSPDFIPRIRRRIYRRTVASQFASYSWHLPKVILIEIAGVLGHFVTAFGGKKDSSS